MKKSPLRSFVNATFFNGLLDIMLKNLTTGPLLTAYVFSFGFGNSVLGFLQSLYPLSCISHLPISFMMEKGLRPKKFSCFAASIGNLFLLFVGISFFFQSAIITDVKILGFPIRYTLGCKLMVLLR